MFLFSTTTDTEAQGKMLATGHPPPPSSPRSPRSPKLKHFPPDTICGSVVGSPKRNILRKGGPFMERKSSAAGSQGSLCHDGSTQEEYGGPLEYGDPNYDSEEDEKGFIPDAFHQVVPDDVRQSKMALTAYKRTIEPLITEYFITGDPADMILNIQEIGAPEYAYECVKRAINMSLDKTDRERELVSQLISIGYPNTFSANTIGKGFERLFEIIDEVEKDVPTARDMVATFVSRAVINEVLPPSFLTDAVVCNLGGDMVEKAKRKLSREHGGGLLDRSWGPGDGRMVQDMKIALDQCLQEYLLSGDLDEATRCIRELNAQLFFHEVVKRAVSLAVDKPKHQREQRSALLQHLHTCDLLTTTQAVKGFQRLFQNINDLALDSPTAPTVLKDFTQRAIDDHVLPFEISMNAMAAAGGEGGGGSGGCESGGCESKAMTV